MSNQTKKPSKAVKEIRKAQDELKSLRQKKDEYELIIEKIELEIQNKREDLHQRMAKATMEKYSVVVGDKIEIDGECCLFRGIDSGRDPVVSKKLKDGSWSKKKLIILGYLWDEKETVSRQFSTGKIKL